MKNCIVCLDLTNFDEHILKACNKIVTPLLQYNSIEFVNVVNDLIHPQQEIHQIIEYTGPQNNLEDKIISIMKNKIDRNMYAKDFKAQITVLEGRPYRELLHRAEVKRADLIVVGSKSRSSYSGITSKRLAHNLDTDILFVPESKLNPIKNIIVPVDFSENSFKALKTAISLASRSENIKVNALHIMSTSHSYAYTTNYYNEYNAMIVEKTKRTMKDFLTPLENDFDWLETTLIKANQFSTADTIKDYSESNNADLIIVGAQSHNKFRNLLIGSTAESLIGLCPNTPLLLKR